MGLLLGGDSPRGNVLLLLQGHFISEIGPAVFMSFIPEPAFRNTLTGSGNLAAPRQACPVVDGMMD